MNKLVVLLISILMLALAGQWIIITRLRSENVALNEARANSEQSRSELEQTFETTRKRAASAETEAESLRIEAAGLRAETQRARQTLSRTADSQNPASTRSITAAPGTASSAQPVAEANQALIDYMGEPVSPTLNTDSRYAKDGVLNAVRLAAQKAGVSIQKMEVDDSEFPVLAGIVCDRESYLKLLAEIKKMDGYGYNSAVAGGDGYQVLNITPAAAYPGANADQIRRRLSIRMEAFYKRLGAAK